MSLRSVSEAFEVYATPDESGCFVKALGAIDRVHADGDLPRVFGTVGRWDPDRSCGYYDPFTHEVHINLRGQAPALTVLHEVEHLLDYEAFGDGRSVVGDVGDARFKPWRNAIRHTRAFERLYDMATIPTHRFYDENGLEHFAYVSDTEHAAFLLDFAELWARSYTQHIALESADPELLGMLDRQRSSSYGTFFKPFWSDEDFQSVRHELDSLMRLKGWKHGG